MGPRTQISASDLCRRRAVASRGIGRLWRHFSGDQAFVLRAVFVIWVVRVSLSLLPFGWVCRVLDWFATTFPSLQNDVDSADVAHVAGIVTALSRRVVGDRSCLTAALVGQLFLRRRGYRSTLRIGVRKDARTGILAHAWLERDGEIVIGGDSEFVGQFVPLSDPRRVTR